MVLVKIAGGIVLFVLGLGMAMGMIILLALMMEGVTRHSEQRDLCLKQSVTGYEIRKCR